MIADTLQFLHTTDAYQAAALEVMAGEANFTARQLDFGESIAPNTVRTNRWRVSPPPYGIGGTISSANYIFEFSQGRLLSVEKIDWLKKSAPPLGDLLDLARQPSLLNTNSAHQLAKQKLAAISVDIEALEAQFPPMIFQVPARRRDPSGLPLSGVSNNIAVPLFMVGWGDDPATRLIRDRMQQLNRPMPDLARPSSLNSAFVQILGTTKEVVKLHVRDGKFSKRPLLQLANVAELLGPLPPPRHFVEALVGGKDAYETISKPDKAEAWLLTSGSDRPKVDRAGPIKLTTGTAKAFSDALLNFDSYLWRDGKACVMDEGARLRFTRGTDTVDIRLCYECDMLSIRHSGSTHIPDFDPAHNALVRALQAAFPNDKIVKGLQLHGSKQ